MTILFPILLFFIYLLICLLLYRIPSRLVPEGKEGEVHYKFFELKMNHRRFFEEAILRNKGVRLVDSGLFYVSKKERKLLWPASPHDMYEKNYTIWTELEVHPLLFGGYGKAKVKRVEKREKKPVLTK